MRKKSSYRQTVVGYKRTPTADVPDLDGALYL